MLAPAIPALIGRDRELAILRDHLTAALDGRGGLVLIGGGAGVGKTALADVLAHEAADAGARVLVGHCYDRTETPPYGPWSECMTQFRAGTHGEAISRVAPPSPAAASNQEAFFAQVRDFATTMAAECPLVIVVEDLHWADVASLDLLRYLARALAPMRLLLVVTYRNDELHRRHPLAEMIPLLVREAPMIRLDLRPLDAAAANTLVRIRYVLPDSDAARLGAYLIERTEGNALFMTELLRTLEEEQLLRREGEQWRVGTIAQAPVPRLLTQVIDARLTRLGDTADALLAVAAVIGHEVPLAVWGAVTQVDEETLVALVERAEAAHLVTAWASGDGFRFTHALIREVLYTGVLAMRRRRLHRQVGETLAALPAPDPDIVAYHFQQAYDGRAVAWLVRAAERAESGFARRAAADRYDAAFTLLDAGQGDTSERGWLQLRAAILRRYEDADTASARVEQTLVAAVAGNDFRLAAYARIIHGYTLASRGMFGAALRATQTGLDALAALPPPDAAQQAREAVFADHLHRGPLVVWLSFVGRFAEAQTQGEALLGDAPTVPITPDAAVRHAPIWSALAFVYIMQGELAHARHADDVARQVLDIAERRRLVIPRIRGAFVREVLACVMDAPHERERIIADGRRRRAGAWGHDDRTSALIMPTTCACRYSWSRDAGRKHPISPSNCVQRTNHTRCGIQA